MNVAVLLQADGVDMPVVNGHETLDVTDARAARGGDGGAQTQSRWSAHTSAAMSDTGDV